MQKEEQIKPKARRRMDILKIRAEINSFGSREAIERKSNELKSSLRISIKVINF